MASGFDGEDLSDSADALRRLGDARAEEKPRPSADEFRMLEEAEENGGSVVGADLFGGHDSFQDSRLLDASDVHSRLESGVDARRVREHNNRRLPNQIKFNSIQSNPAESRAHPGRAGT